MMLGQKHSTMNPSRYINVQSQQNDCRHEAQANGHKHLVVHLLSSGTPGVGRQAGAGRRDASIGGRGRVGSAAGDRRRSSGTDSVAAGRDRGRDRSVAVRDGTPRR